MDRDPAGSSRLAPGWLAAWCPWLALWLALGSLACSPGSPCLLPWACTCTCTWQSCTYMCTCRTAHFPPPCKENQHSCCTPKPPVGPHVRKTTTPAVLPRHLHMHMHMHMHMHRHMYIYIYIYLWLGLMKRARIKSHRNVFGACQP